MQKSILLAAILAANIITAHAGMQAEPGLIERASSVVRDLPDPEILCRSADPWDCLKIKKMQLSCRTEDIDGGDPAAALDRLGIKEARQRYTEAAGKAGSTLFLTRQTGEPRMIFVAGKKTASGCALDGAPELIRAVVGGVEK